MPCGGSNRSEPIQITIPSRDKPLHGDWHCPDCGVILERRSKYYKHHCQGVQDVPYQRDRQRTCDQCEYSVDDVCVEYKRLHPDRDCRITVGVRIPYAQCPAGKWLAIQRDCNLCGRRTVNLSGIDHCRWCGGVS